MSGYATYRDLSNFADSAKSCLMDCRDRIRAMRRKLMVRLCASLLFTCLILLAAAAPCHAQQMNESDSPCAGVVVTSDLVSCFSKAKDASDAKLNSVYQSIRKKLDSDDSTRLIETQRLWIKYRDANCAAARALYGNGTAQGPAYLACMEAMTRARAKELQVTYTVRLKD